MTMLKSFLRDENGATAIEYGLIAAGISVAIITVVQGLGSSLNTTFGSVTRCTNAIEAPIRARTGGWNFSAVGTA
jgi:pilus assembly protein Flp/PilA